LESSEAPPASLSAESAASAAAVNENRVIRSNSDSDRQSSCDADTASPSVDEQSRSGQDTNLTVLETTDDDTAATVAEATVRGSENERNIGSEPPSLEERVESERDTAVKSAKANVGDCCDDVDESVTQNSSTQNPSNGIDCKPVGSALGSTTDDGCELVCAAAVLAADGRGNVSGRPSVPVKKIQPTSVTRQSEKKTQVSVENSANQQTTKTVTVKDVGVNGRRPAGGWKASEVKAASAAASANASRCRSGTDVGRASTTTSLAPGRPATSPSAGCFSGQHQQRTQKSSDAVAASAPVTKCAQSTTLASSQARNVDGNTSAMSEERQQEQLSSSTLVGKSVASKASDSAATSVDGSRQTTVRKVNVDVSVSSGGNQITTGNSRISRSSAYDQHVSEWTKGLVHQRRKVMTTTFVCCCSELFIRFCIANSIINMANLRAKSTVSPLKH
jgi:hypothetical protein